MKTKRFQSGGMSANPNITDDVRARALRFARGETELSGKSYDDPLKEVIREAEKRDAARIRAAKKELSPVMKEVIAAGKRREKERQEEEAARAAALRDANTLGFDIPAGIGEYVGSQDRPKYPRRFKSGGSVSSASKRADGIAKRGKTKGRVC